MATVFGTKSHADERMAIALTGPQQALGTNDLGFDTPVNWFPNILEGRLLTQGTQFKLQAFSAADIAALTGVADGQQLGLIVTFRKYDNGDPATGNLINEEVVTSAQVEDSTLGSKIDPTVGNCVAMTRNFIPDSIGFQVIIPTGNGGQPSGLKIYAL